MHLVSPRNGSKLVTEKGKVQVITGLLVWISLLALITHLTHIVVSERTRLLFVSAFTSLITLLLSKLGRKNGQ
jgi:hypothetical protein